MIVGQRFPDAENVYVGDKPFAKDEFFAGKRAVIVSLPGAFTPV